MTSTFSKYLKRLTCNDKPLHNHFEPSLATMVSWHSRMLFKGFSNRECIVRHCSFLQAPVPLDSFCRSETAFVFISTSKKVKLSQAGVQKARCLITRLIRIVFQRPMYGSGTFVKNVWDQRLKISPCFSLQILELSAFLSRIDSGQGRSIVLLCWNLTGLRQYCFVVGLHQSWEQSTSMLLSSGE